LTVTARVAAGVARLAWLAWLAWLAHRRWDLDDFRVRNTSTFRDGFDIVDHFFDLDGFSRGDFHAFLNGDGVRLADHLGDLAG